MAGEGLWLELVRTRNCPVWRWIISMRRLSQAAGCRYTGQRALGRVVCMFVLHDEVRTNNTICSGMVQYRLYILIRFVLVRVCGFDVPRHVDRAVFEVTRHIDTFGLADLLDDLLPVSR